MTRSIFFKLAILVNAAIGLVATQAMAHFQIGRYEGTSVHGACGFEIKSVNFKNNLKHPLNERVEVKLDFGHVSDSLESSAVEMVHLAIVDSEIGSVRPKHEILTAVLPFAGGAHAAELFMNDNGPFKMTFVSDNYKNANKNFKMVCDQLTYKGQ
jgi:hypothetical protein